ncbi:MAG TPA: HAMP domain-containing protein [Proteobacteria bacterium]|mgnify:CR=1 FL=1|nr:HAMP domain-containing protein [Pseudomonadota bacterium]
MTVKFRYTLQRTMITYLLLIGFAAVMVGMEFVIETSGSEFRELWQAHSEQTVGQAINDQDVFQPLVTLRNKMILMLGIIMSVVVIVLTMFIKNITRPLQYMIETSREISMGDLSRTIRIDTDNELAELGNVINEMSSNLQEIIHFSLNTCAAGKELIAETASLLNRDSPPAEALFTAGENLALLDQQLAKLREVINCFEFYTIDQPPHV